MFYLTGADNSVNSKAQHLDWCKVQLENAKATTAEGPDDCLIKWIRLYHEAIVLGKPQQLLTILDSFYEPLAKLVMNNKAAFTCLSETKSYRWEIKFKKGKITQIDFHFKWPKAWASLQKSLLENLSKPANMRMAASELNKLTTVNQPFFLLALANKLEKSQLMKSDATRVKAAFPPNKDIKISAAAFGCEIALIQFFKHCQEIFNYTAFLKKTEAWGAYRFATHMAARICPYCNINYTSIIKIKGEDKSRPELDHFLPKSVYPFFAVSYFNLIPVCHSCNHAKRDINVVNRKAERFEYTHLHPYLAEDDQTQRRIFKIAQPTEHVTAMLNGKSELKSKDIVLTDSAKGNSKLKNSLETYHLTGPVDNNSKGVEGHYGYHINEINSCLTKAYRYPPKAFKNLSQLLGDEDHTVLVASFVDELIPVNPNKESLGKFKKDLLEDALVLWRSAVLDKKNRT
jgi:hypothetical protein